MLEKAVEVKNRVDAAVARGRAQGKGRAQARSAASNPMRGPGLSSMAPSGAPVSVSYPQGPTYHTVTRSTPEVTSVKGRAFLGNVNSTGSSYNIVGGTFSLNPVLLNDRLSIMASTFDKYVYTKVKVCYVPFAPTSQSGQVYLYLDRDYLDPLADPSQVGQIMSQYNAISDQPWKNMSTALIRDPTEKRTYFTLLNQAQMPETEQFRAACYVTASGYTGIIGQLYLEYSLDLVGPVYSPSSIGYSGNALSNFVYSAAVNGAGSMTFDAVSSMVHGSATAGALFGIPDTNDARVWEVVIADCGSASPVTLTSLVWGRTTGPAVQIQNGSTWYVVRQLYTATQVGNIFNIFQSYQDAMSGDTSASIYNTSAVAQSWINSGTKVWVRQIANTLIASQV